MAQASRKLSRSEKKLFLITGVAIILILALGAWRSYVDTIPDVKIPTPQMPKPNAYDFYIQAGNVIVAANPAVDPVHDPTSVPKAQWKKRYPTAAKEAWLRSNAQTLNLMRQGFNYPCRVPPQRSLYVGTIGFYGKFRGMARMLVVESHARGERGHWDKAFESALDTLHLGHDIAQGGVLIDYLVGEAVNSIGRSTAWEVLPHLSASEAKSAARRLEKIIEGRNPYANVLREEMYFGQASLIESMRSPEWRDININEATGLALWNARWQVFKTPKRTVFNNYTNYMNALIFHAQKPYNPKDRFPVIPDDFYTQAVGPVFSKSHLHYARGAVGADLLLVALALRAYHLENNTYPKTLDELVPRYLKRIPVDAFGAGESLRYKVMGEKYSLYSIGSDGIDNQGRAIEDKSKTGRVRYLVTPESKGDFVAGINH